MKTYVKSRQERVPFVYCSSPITIDKRASWGQSDDNFQHAPNGAFLKLNGDFSISHLVQPNEDTSAPIGWQPSNEVGDIIPTYDKKPIWVEKIEAVEIARTLSLSTKDGNIAYELKPTVAYFMCWNGDESGPDENDVWVQTEEELKKNYNIQ